MCVFINLVICWVAIKMLSNFPLSCSIATLHMIKVHLVLQFRSTASHRALAEP